MVADVLESAGWDVRFLGTDTPLAGVLQAVEKHRADVLGISATMLFNLVLPHPCRVWSPSAAVQRHARHGLRAGRCAPGAASGRPSVRRLERLRIDPRGCVVWRRRCAAGCEIAWDDPLYFCLSRRRLSAIRQLRPAQQKPQDNRRQAAPLGLAAEVARAPEWGRLGLPGARGARLGTLVSERQGRLAIAGLPGCDRPVVARGRIGLATDSFNIRWATLSTDLAELQNEVRFGVDVRLRTIGRMWVRRGSSVPLRTRLVLRRRHKVPTRGIHRFSLEVIYGELGVIRLRRVHLGPHPNLLW